MRFLDTSQGGEGTFLCDYFKDLPTPERTLVDVGAYGKDFSNTWNLLAEGWKGLLIDANPQRIPVIEAEFSGFDYKLLSMAVGSHDTTMKLRIHNRVGSSSFLPDWEPEGYTGQEIEIQMRKFPDVLRENAVPCDFTLLCVDAEGMDKEILEGLLCVSEFKPRIIISEVFGYGSDTKAVLFFLTHGYRFVHRFEVGNPWGNMMFERKA